MDSNHTSDSPQTPATAFRHKNSAIYSLEWRCLEGWCVLHAEGGQVHQALLGTTHLKEAQLWSYEKSQELRSVARRRWPRLLLLQPFSAGTYFVQAGPGGPIKIGFSTQVIQRMYGLYKSYRDDNIALTLLGVLPGNIEKQLHFQFKNNALVGEWFKPADDLLNFLRKRGITPLPSHFGQGSFFKRGERPLVGAPLIKALTRIHKDAAVARTVRVTANAMTESRMINKDCFPAVEPRPLWLQELLDKRRRRLKRPGLTNH